MRNERQCVTGRDVMVVVSPLLNFLGVSSRTQLDVVTLLSDGGARWPAALFW